MFDFDIILQQTKIELKMNKTEKKSGGVRQGAGRKPTEDKIQPVYIGIRRSVIEEHGGKEIVKAKSEFFINNPDDFKYIGDEGE